MYPTPDEKVYIDAAEKLMIETMARYDPSHDAYHGELQAPDRVLGNIYIQFSAFGRPRLL